MGELIDEVQVSARGWPALFVSAAFAAGFAAARLGKVVAGDLSLGHLPTVPRPAAASPDLREGRSLEEIAGGLAGDVQALVRGSLALARAEFNRKLHSLVSGALLLVGGLIARRWSDPWCARWYR